MKKRILSLLLVATMLVGASMTAAASETTLSSISGNTITATASVKQATISVKVTVINSTISLNPYHLSSVSYTGLDGSTTVSANAADTMTPQYIKFENNSDVAIGVGLKGKLVLTNESQSDPIKVATSKPTNTTTGKQVFVEAEVVSDTLASNGNYMKPATAAKFYYDDAAKITATVKEKELAQNAVPVMCVPAKDGENGTTTGTKLSNGIVVIVSGGTSADAAHPWLSGDKVDVVTTYNLQYMTGSMKESMFK